MSQPLAGIKVLELSTGVAGPFASKLLADYGADVIKVEPPEGDETRRHGPFPEDDNDPEQSALFLHLNTNKRSVVADLTTAEGQDLVRSLVAEVDIVIESFTPGTLDDWSLGWDHLRAINPSLVLASITPFGQTGPYARFKGEEILYYAIGGPMRATGLAEREPVKLAGNLIQYQCGNVASGAILAAHSVAQTSGEGVHLDVSNLETQTGTIDRRSTYLLHHQWTGLNCVRSPGFEQRAAPVGMFPTSDGYVQLITMPNWVDRMAETLDDDELRRRFAQPDWIDDEELPDLVDAALYPWTLTRTMAEAARDAQAHKFPVTPLNKPVDLVDDPHFAERGFWVDVDHPVAGTIRQPGSPWKIDDGWAIRRPAPTLGQHTDEVVAEAAVVSPVASTAQRSSGEQRLPLEGIRVLDLTVVWAGPFATMFLADLGADVVRLDNPHVWPTATRGALPRPTPERAESLGPLAGSYPNFEAGEHPWNRNGMWAAQARNKRGITLDIRTDLGRKTFFDLLDQADMVVENNSRDVLDKLGIGWEQIHARNPRAILVRMPPMGASGPYSNYIGFGAHFEALCGMTAIRGYEGADPSTINSVFHMDPATGGAGLFAALCALRRREQTGIGELVEIPQSENMMQHIGEYLIDAARSGTEHEAIGNRHTVRAPQGCYPCLGEDAWAVISVGSDDEWAGLRRAMGEPEWAADDRFATAQGRHRYHDELDELLAMWTETLTPADVFHRCQAEGVPAGPVLNEAECLADEHLRERSFFRRSGSVDLGEWDFVNHLWKWTGPEMVWGPIGRLGVDNDDVYRGVLGLDDDEMMALDEDGHLSTVYRKPNGSPW